MEGAREGIEAKFGFARTLVGAVAVVSLVGEDRAHLAAKIDGSVGPGKAGVGKKRGEQENGKAEAGHGCEEDAHVNIKL